MYTEVSGSFVIGESGTCPVVGYGRAVTLQQHMSIPDHYQPPSNLHFHVLCVCAAVKYEAVNYESTHSLHRLCTYPQYTPYRFQRKLRYDGIMLGDPRH